jgi:hypothetical protein
MALVTFLGVIFIQAGSQMLNGAVILLTITSFASSMLVLADLEQPYTGAHDLAPPLPHSLSNRCDWDFAMRRLFLLKH